MGFGVLGFRVLQSYDDLELCMHVCVYIYIDLYLCVYLASVLSGSYGYQKSMLSPRAPIAL